MKQYTSNKSSGEHHTLTGGLLCESFCGVALDDLAAEAMNMPDQTSELYYGDAAEFSDEFGLDRTNGGFTKTVKMGVKGNLDGIFNRFGTVSTDQMPLPYETLACNYGVLH